MFSKTTEYALRATLFIAQKGSVESKVSLEEIARAIDSPPSFTAKILQQLTSPNGLISSVRGPGGGFFLTKKNKNQPVRAVIEAMDEDNTIRKCVLGLKLCSEKDPCPMHHGYKSIKKQLTELFDKKTIGELAAELESGYSVIRNTPLHAVR